MEPLQWVASVLFAIWGLAHVAFGLTTIYQALTNQSGELLAGLIGAAPNLDAIKAAADKLPKGPNFIFAQHGCNVLKPGVFALLLAFWLIPSSDRYPVLTAFVTIDIFFDHNFYGVMVDWVGIATAPVANAMLYFANIAVVCSLWDLANRQKTIANWIGVLFLILASTVMFISTVFHLLRLLGKSGPFDLSVEPQKDSVKADVETPSRTA